MRPLISILYWLALSVLPFGPYLLNDILVGDLNIRQDQRCLDIVVMFVGQQAYFILIAAALIWPVAAYKIFVALRRRSTGQTK